MKKLSSVRIVLFFTCLTVMLTWVVIFGYEKLLREPFYSWVERHYPDRKVQDAIEQRVEHFAISTMVDMIVVTLLLRLINRQQRRLVESEERYRTLFEHASDGIGVVTAYDHRLIDVNKKFTEILGARPEGLVGAHVCDLFRGGDVDERPDLISEVFSCAGPSNHELEPRGQSSEAEIIIRTASGASLAVSASCNTITMGKERLLILIIRDLTERKRLEMEKQEMERQLFQSSKLASIGELSAGVAHEINNPLNAIINFAQLLKDDGVARNDSERQMIDGIIDEGERIAKIVRDLLTFARQHPHRPAQVEVAPVIENSLSLFGYHLRKDGITVETEIAGDTLPVWADASRLRQVVVNMISNAHHALSTKAGGEKLFRITAHNAEREGRRVVRLEFYDNGVGIRREYLDKVFDPFFTTRRDSGGTGLGLSLSFGIIKNYNGRITVESEEGSYTRFVVELPAAGAEGDYAESLAGGRRAEYSLDDGGAA